MAKNDMPSIVMYQSINQSIYFQDGRIDLIIVIFMHLVHPMIFCKICWPDVRRGNRSNCELHDLVISVGLLEFYLRMYLYIYTKMVLWQQHPSSSGQLGQGGGGEARARSNLGIYGQF